MKLPFSHRWKNTSTCGRGLTEYLLNTGRIPQTAERVRKSPGNQIGKKIKKKMRTELGWDLHPWEGAVRQERCSHPSPAGGTAWTVVCRTERCAHRVLATTLQSLVLVQTDLGWAQGRLCGDRPKGLECVRSHNQGYGVCVRPWAQVHRRSPSSGQSSLRN